jgi:AcrR family transcriptional regulator
MSTEQTSPLRERIKRETRSSIAAAAARLFAQHGFREVTVDAVARQAGVSRQTVFNHFAVKEELVFDRAQGFSEHMVAAVRDRPAGTSLIEVIRAEHRAFWTPMHSLPDPRPRGSFFDLVAANPSLQTYGRELNARAARRIADVIADSRCHTPDDLRPRVIADALLGVYAATFDAIQHHITAAEHPRLFLDGVLEQADHAFDLLQQGLGKYP